ncbi:hypothetical protein QAD02_017431 [Eretmocerus hayati]|uniref:Uncharacterized protein n=1 Tax=Eretmocerus hayati TaxID=131215 RepID=A0ACC2PDH8_9HYME|nr:hypothetical protein QAD02_017431 [Eretmocerus hayati]
MIQALFCFSVNAMQYVTVSNCWENTVAIEKHPFLASVEVLKTSSQAKVPVTYYVGAILSDRFVLGVTPCQRSSILKRCGNGPHEYLVRAGPDALGTGGIEHPAELILHENYLSPVKQGVGPVDDVALYKVRDRIHFGPRAQPTQILRQNARAKPGDSALSVGWAYDVFSAKNSKIRAVNLTVIDSVECLEMKKRPYAITAKIFRDFESLDVQVPPGHLCTIDNDGSHPMQSSCYGYEDVLIVDGQLAGLYSIEQSQYTRNQLTYVYVDVAHYREWVLSRTGI